MLSDECTHNIDHLADMRLSDNVVDDLLKQLAEEEVTDHLRLTVSLTLTHLHCALTQARARLAAAEGEVERLNKQAAWYETRCVNYGTFVTERDATIDHLKARLAAAEKLCEAWLVFEKIPVVPSEPCQRAARAMVDAATEWQQARKADDVCDT